MEQVRATDTGAASLMAGCAALTGICATGMPLIGGMAMAPAVVTMSNLNSSIYSTSDPRLSRQEQRKRRESAQVGTFFGDFTKDALGSTKEVNLM